MQDQFSVHTRYDIPGLLDIDKDGLCIDDPFDSLTVGIFDLFLY
jgi:hypothetical protein